MKIFITGGSGLIGQYLNIYIAEKHDILTQYYRNKGNCKEYNSVQLQLNDYDKLKEIFENFRPDAVVHAAAISNSAKADSLSRSYVYEINVNATKKLAELSERYNSKIIYLSTDLVYAGYRGSYLNENAKLIPVSLYAETKLMGEQKIKEATQNYIILREALIYGFGLNHTTNFFQETLKKIKNNERVKLFTDQFRSPLSLKVAARMIARLIEIEDLKSETLNFGGNERLSRYDLIDFACKIAGLRNDLLIKTTMDEENYPYKVYDVSLNIDKLKSYGIEPDPLEESIADIFRQ
ncbi:putative dTDP-4-dehydrorhamnose reductase [Melioribacter roseus P3M-2]|uniref:Putative dTDP-4-dehydrorhamnose reductase n=1 Tax=Melioribacter roseus (strain DSM 23840 / JCM 17771 / VKM B-2668 / P3M-2) TaxID=1191523 RepID=I6Z704_MELRP|nr:SDR family oxidoreductase [Melioribacter roseus]AFN74935.1 putative dTDP-4-dehydrorhamnose reductase [Melioribacter roseus P3M-2]